MWGINMEYFYCDASAIIDLFKYHKDSESLELDPSMAEEFEKAIKAITNKDSQ